MKKLYIIAAMILTAVATFSLSAKVTPTLQDVKVSDVKIKHQGDELKISFSLDLSQIKVGSERQIIYTPVIKSGENAATLQKIVVNGRNVDIKEQRDPSRKIKDAAQTIVYKKGVTNKIAVSGSVPFNEWMNYSELNLCEDICGCGQLELQDCREIAAFDNRPAPEPLQVFVAPKAEAVKTRAEKGSAFVDYVVNTTDIRPTYRRNKQEIAKIIATIDLVKNDPNVSITEVNIHGYASPEGRYDRNTVLAEGRAASLKEYVKSLYTLPDKIFTSNATPEDWEGLRKMVDSIGIDNREQILAIIDNPAFDPDQRDAEIRKRFPQSYAYMLREWYPALRHSDYTVSYVVRPFTIEETKEIMLRNPKQVSLNEMFLVAQTLVPGSEEFNKIMDIAVKTYPDDPTANLNAACAALSAGDLFAAGEYLAKADNSAEAANARGILEMKRGNLDKARQYFEQAEQAGIEAAKENLAILARQRKLIEQNAD